MYIEGAYCAWIPPIRSSARGRGVFARSSRSCRASSARLSSRSVSVRSSGMGRRLTVQPELEIAADEELHVSKSSVQLAHRDVVGVVPGEELREALPDRPSDLRRLRHAREAPPAELGKRGGPFVLRAPA